LIEKRKIIPISSSSNGLVQSLQRRIDPRVYPEEEEASMNNSTTP